MCFKPEISVSTAIIEFLVSLFIFFYYRKSRLAKFLALFVFLLGFYQLTEFFICTTTHSSLWATLGFITYTFLPPVALHLTINYIHKKVSTFLIYLPAVVFSTIALASSNFITESSCGTVFVIVKNLFFNLSENTFLTIIYWIYYLLFMGIGLIIFYQGFKNEKNQTRRKIYLIAFTGTILSILPAFILIIIFPSLGIMFPSIFCQFAIIFSILALIAVRLERSLQDVVRRKN